MYAKENIKIDEIDNILEVLKTDFNISNKEVKISYNKVLVKADLGVKILYLTDDNRINSVNSTIPIMGFVDIENVNEENICDTNYVMQNILLRPNSNEEHSIYIEAEVEVSCFAYQSKQINIIKDLYSTNSEITFAKKNVTMIRNKNKIDALCPIDEQIQLPELGNGKIYNVDINTRITNQNIMNDKINYEGEIELNFIFESDNIINLDTKRIKLDFNYTMNVDKVNSNSNIYTVIDIKQQDFIIKQDGNIECKIQLGFHANIENYVKINIIDEINKEDLKSLPDYSMVIYFVKNNESLWDIAKKFKSTKNDIMKVNELEDEAKLKAGMQLFIPKYNLIKSA